MYRSVNEILKVLANIDTSKAMGADKITAIFLKECKDVIAPSLCILFDMSLGQGKYPSEWRRANVTPISKKVMCTGCK